MSKAAELWDVYHVSLHLDFIKGGTPKNENMMRAWIESNYLKGLTSEQRELVDIDSMVDQTKAELGADIDESMKEFIESKESKGFVGFKKTDKGIYIEPRQVKAMMKEAANILKEILGKKNFRSKVAERVFVHGTEEDHKIYLYKQNGTGRKLIQEPDNVEEKPIQVMTPQGPRSAFKKIEVINDAVCDFKLSLLRDEGRNAVSVEDVAAMLEFAQVNGLGAERSQGAGQFSVVSVTEGSARKLPDSNDILAQFKKAKSTTVTKK